jgi:putative transposase
MPEFHTSENSFVFHRRNLPHLFMDGGTLFLTYRLAGSLPAVVIDKLRMDHERQQKQKPGLKNKDGVFLSYDQLLDEQKNKIHHLADPRIAKICADQFHYYNGKDYELDAFCIMSNHIHVAFTLKPGARPVSKIMHSIKRYTARESNKILGRSGKFWQDESYDHLVRDEQELSRIKDYIINNPVKAGLVKDWRDWKWTYLADK